MLSFVISVIFQALTHVGAWISPSLLFMAEYYSIREYLQILNWSFIHLLVDIWAVATFGLLWMLLLWTYVYTYALRNFNVYEFQESLSQSRQRTVPLCCTLLPALCLRNSLFCYFVLRVWYEVSHSIYDFPRLTSVPQYHCLEICPGCYCINIPPFWLLARIWYTGGMPQSVPFVTSWRTCELSPVWGHFE